MFSDKHSTTEPIGWSWRAHWLPPRRRQWHIMRWLKRIFLALIAIAFIGIVAGFFGYVRTVQSYNMHTDVRGDAVVTLTGGAQRIDEALQILARGGAKRMLISGVNEQTTRDEIIRLNPSYASLFLCCVDLDYRARNTIGNAIQARYWANEHGFKTLIIVTSNYHMPRTLVELGHVMPKLEKIPYAVAAGSIKTEGWWSDATTMRLLVSEYLKYLVAWGRTKIEKDPERSPAARILGKPVKNIVEPGN
ncbi:YdcF family protein [Microvirga sp. W0021]|uniref:YdcF family protein n=1 Tax=Hohaiivirga grylli TaxID=3133970 RepID=A0ABV0BM16_9HYPH